MEHEIGLIFHNRGLRSYIEVDLCRQCPRQDDKGCCGYYSPVFYLADFAYWLEKKPDLVDHLFSLPNLTVLDASVTMNSAPEGDSYRCRFHGRENGCFLTQELRESICRHFVCPGINWEVEPHLQHWRLFFEKLGEYEISLNNQMAEIFKERGLSLRDPLQRRELLGHLPGVFHDLTVNSTGFLASCPILEEAVIRRPLVYGKEWRL
ncbi:MAG TPA: hypothetical protein VN426_10230 [Syntrophomonadaceae bacterium]|nr:hypothetical protein [Syntrophomonadaceae bacterium]